MYGYGRDCGGGRRRGLWRGILAGVGAGLWPTVDAACDALVRGAAPVNPQPDVVPPHEPTLRGIPPSVSRVTGDRNPRLEHTYGHPVSRQQRTGPSCGQPRGRLGLLRPGARLRSRIDRTADCISLTNGALRLYLLRIRHGRTTPWFRPSTCRTAARRWLNCRRRDARYVPIGPHAPDDFYVKDPFGVVFDVVGRPDAA